ncbi:MAG TPA: biopolymer transporter ExbD [Phycisphaerae bacterium]|nr:biopolymer transporter ExbD [Phycisphaerae bacterium]HPM22794.1 biopolymer transporter ExbD [Phycisphaerae bacterium]
MKPRAPAAEVVPNLAPMVDVIMVLLVFFLLGTSLDLVSQGVLQTELDPSSGPGAGAAVEIKPLVRIALADVGSGSGAIIYVMDELLGQDDFESLHRFLLDRRRAGADPENPVVIGAETTVRWKFVVKAMDAAVRAGFTNVQFAVSFRAGSLSDSAAGSP